MSTTSWHLWRKNEDLKLKLLIRDTPDWKKKYPLGPVHFDVRCDIHNVEYLEISPEKLPGGPKEFISFLKCCYP